MKKQKIRIYFIPLFRANFNRSRNYNFNFYSNSYISREFPLVVTTQCSDDQGNRNTHESQKQKQKQKRNQRVKFLILIVSVRKHSACSALFFLTLTSAYQRVSTSEVMKVRLSPPVKNRFCFFLLNCDIYQRVSTSDTLKLLLL